MLRAKLLKLHLCALLLVPGLVIAQSMDGVWTLRLLDLEHRERVVAIVRFNSTPASRSCMSGSWKTLTVESTSSSEAQFFPISEPLAWELGDGFVILGRTQVCDGYLFMQGLIGEEAIAGPLYALGLGFHKDLGQFVLQRRPD